MSVCRVPGGVLMMILPASRKVQLAVPVLEQNQSGSQHENIHQSLSPHLGPGPDQAGQGGSPGGGEAPAAPGGALLLRQDCWRRGNSQDRGEHLQLGQWQGQGEPGLCGALRVRDVQDWRDNVGPSLPGHVPHQVSKGLGLTLQLAGTGLTRTLISVPRSASWWLNNSVTPSRWTQSLELPSTGGWQVSCITTNLYPGQTNFLQELVISWSVRSSMEGSGRSLTGWLGLRSSWVTWSTPCQHLWARRTTPGNQTVFPI